MYYILFHLNYYSTVRAPSPSSNISNIEQDGGVAREINNDEVLDDELRETLTERYADDFETFSYDP